MKTVSDIMVTKLITVQEMDSVHHARNIIKEKGIRHIPVVDDKGMYKGLLTQRDMLSHAFTIVEKYGMSRLQRYEEREQAVELMAADAMSVASDTLLIDAGEHFLCHKHSCLPIVDEGELKGIVTSIDFVKLALELLK